MTNRIEPGLIDSIPHNLRAFKVYNQVKTLNVLRDCSEAEQDAFHLIPYLLHTSNPHRLGFVDSEKCPAGIQFFNWKQDIQSLFSKYFGKREKFDIKSSDTPAPIEFLSVMGSVGSIAYTTHSDLDYWCCIRNDSKQKERQAIEAKCLKIEAWCKKELDLEVHFFITTAEELCQNQFGEVSKESCGSALGKLLKEEYYRGSIHLAGKIPYWWVLPLGLKDDQYAQTVHKLKEADHPYHYEYIDIGNIHEIPYEEFLGGGLWQINKGIGSAFKSALKMALLLDYSDPVSNRELLATRLKRLVQENPNQFENLDAYQLLIDRVLEYYRKQDDLITIELLRKCFFLKIEPKVSRWWDSPNTPKKTSDAVMLQYCRKWYWQLPDVERLEKFNYLDIKEARAFKVQLEHFMLNGVRKLVERTIELSVEHSILPEELLKMQNRLIATFDSNRPKAEWYYLPFDHFIKNKAYTFRLISNHETITPKWVLYNGVHDLKAEFGRLEEKQVLLESNSLSDLIVWMLYNQLIKQSTSITINLNQSHRFASNLKELSKRYNHFFGPPALPDLNDGGYSEHPLPTRWIISINLIPSHYQPSLSDDLEQKQNQEDFEVQEQEHKQRNLFTTESFHSEHSDEEEETTMMDTVHGHVSQMKINEILSNIIESQPNSSSQTSTTKSFEPEPSFEPDSNQNSNDSKRMRLSFMEDPFNAWDKKVSLLYSGHIIEKNTWGEVQIIENKGVTWLAKSLSHIITHCLKLRIRPQDVVKLHFGQCEYDIGKLKPRCKSLIKQVFEFFFPKETSAPEFKTKRKAFIFEMGGAAHALIESQHSIKVLHFPNLVNAMAAINLHCCEPVQVGFDTGTALGSFYQTAVELAKDGQIDAYFQVMNQSVDFIVIDEIGHVITTKVQRKDLRAYFPRFVYSLLLCMQKVMTIDQNSPLHQAQERLNISWISKGAKGRRKVKNVTEPSIEMIKTAIKRLKEVDFKLVSDHIRGFMMVYLYEGRLDFKDTKTKQHYQELLQRIHTMRERHLEQGKKHYRFFLSDLQLDTFDLNHLEVEDRTFLQHVSSWMCIKMSVEAAIVRDSLISGQ